MCNGIKWKLKFNPVIIRKAEEALTIKKNREQYNVNFTPKCVPFKIVQYINASESGGNNAKLHKRKLSCGPEIVGYSRP